MAKPLGRFAESHNDDVTQVVCRGNNLLTCSIDDLLCMFVLPERGPSTGDQKQVKHPRIIEDDVIDGTYRAT
jgi:hypothetical protein